MKKFVVYSAMLAGCVAASAQYNVQLHYDLGHNLYSDAEAQRQAVTATFEFLKPDRLGSTFMFIDLDFHGNDTNNNGAMGAYCDLSRDFTVKHVNEANNITAHFQYTGGLNTTAGSYQQAMMIGPAWQWHSMDFSRMFILQVSYKQYFKHLQNEAHPSFQVATIWNINFAQGLFTFNGLAETWYGYSPDFVSIPGAPDPVLIPKKKVAFLAEPQFWINVIGRERPNDRLSVGTEWEISNNFIYPSQGTRSFFINPTLALKYTF
ncbi:MAG: DUF5020 family protein [Bacteroidales bacterium]|nr:DUF5020 family protein [Bacteroidales bacterium]